MAWVGGRGNVVRVSASEQRCCRNVKIPFKYSPELAWLQPYCLCGVLRWSCRGIKVKEQVKAL